MEIRIREPFKAHNGQVQNAVIEVSTPIASYTLNEGMKNPRFEGIVVKSIYDNEREQYVIDIEVSKKGIFNIEKMLDLIFEAEEQLEAEALNARETLFSIVENWAKDTDINLIEG